MSSSPSCSHQPFAGAFLCESENHLIEDTYPEGLNGIGCIKGDASSHSVDDVLGGKYRVCEVTKDATGGEAYCCERMADGLEVVVNRVISFTDDGGSASQGYKEEITVRVEQDDRHLSPLQQYVLHCLTQASPDHEDAFEVRDGERMSVYVVKKAKTSKSFEVGSPSTKLTNVWCFGEPHENPTDIQGAFEQRPGPLGARSTVRKRRDRELFVDIPPIGCCKGSEAVLICSAYRWLGLLVCCGSVLIVIILALNPFPLLILPLTAIIWIAGLFLLKGALQAAFLHESLSLTPTEFRISRRVRWKRSVRNAACDRQGTEAAAMLMDRLFARQVVGRTADLLRAKVQKSANSVERPYEKLVLWEGTIKHQLSSILFEPEMEWIAREINRFIESTKPSLLDP